MVEDGDEDSLPRLAAALEARGIAKADGDLTEAALEDLRQAASILAGRCVGGRTEFEVERAHANAMVAATLILAGRHEAAVAELAHPIGGLEDRVGRGRRDVAWRLGLALPDRAEAFLACERWTDVLIDADRAGAILRDCGDSDPRIVGWHAHAQLHAAEAHLAMGCTEASRSLRGHGLRTLHGLIENGRTMHVVFLRKSARAAQALRGVDPAEACTLLERALLCVRRSMSNDIAVEASAVEARRLVPLVESPSAGTDRSAWWSELVERLSRCAREAGGLACLGRLRTKRCDGT